MREDSLFFAIIIFLTGLFYLHGREEKKTNPKASTDIVLGVFFSMMFIVAIAMFINLILTRFF